MLKFKLLVAGIIMMAFGVYGLIQTGLIQFGLPFLLGTLLCAAIILPKVFRVKRDRRIVASAQQQMELPIHTPQPTPHMASKNRPSLFVPPELL